MIRRIALAALVAVLCIVGGSLSGCASAAPVHDPVRVPSAPAAVEVVNVRAPIPPCAHDDYNDGAVPLCYTVRVTDGAVVVIDAADEVVSAGE